MEGWPLEFSGDHGEMDLWARTWMGPPSLGLVISTLYLLAEQRGQTGTEK